MTEPLLAAAFLHPGLALAGAAAITIPVIIHLIHRRRFRSVPWAAMEFLLAAHQKTRRRIELEHLLLLLLRIAIVALFCLAIARPLLPAAISLGLGNGPRHHVLIVDNSYSASPRPDDPNASFTSPPAVAVARDIIDSLPAQDALSILTAAAPAEAPLGYASFDRRGARAELDAVQPTFRATDLAGALDQAKQLVDESPMTPGSQAVYVISDLTRTAWLADTQTLPTAREMAESTNLILVPTNRDAKPNIAVTSLVSRDDMISVRLPIRISATVVNYDRQSADGHSLQVRLDGRIGRTLDIATLSPGIEQRVDFSIAIPQAGDHVIEVRIEPPPDDAYPEDNARRLALHVAESMPVLIVDGRPARNPLQGAAGYLATALAPTADLTASNAADPNVETPQSAGLDAAPPIAPRLIAELELADTVLEDYRLIALCDVQRLEPQQWQRIERAVYRGMGLLIFLGDHVSVDNYNRFGHSNGQGLLPGTLSSPTGDLSQRDTFVRLQQLDPPHPAMAEFIGAQDVGLFQNARVHRYMPIAVDRKRAEPVLNYTNGSPAIVEMPYGDGRVLLVTTTANMEWNNIPARGDYVSLVWAMVARLSRSPFDAFNLEPGDAVTMPLPPNSANESARLQSATGEAIRLDIAVRGEGYALLSEPLDAPGVYSLKLAASDRKFAANINPQESDTRTPSPEDRRTFLDFPHATLTDLTNARADLGQAGSESLSLWMLAMAGAMMIVESYLAMRFAAEH